MKICIVSCVFPPEPITSASTSADLAEEMVKRGHTVTVISPFPNRPAGRVIDGYNRKWKRIEDRKGYKVIHCWHTLSKRSDFISRFFENISFGLTSTWHLWKENKPDVVYMNTWPLFSQSFNSWLLSLSKVPIVCSVQDIYPESLIGKGALKSNGWIAQVIRSIDIKHLRRCSHVVSISPPMVDRLLKDRCILPEKVHFIPNWMDACEFSPDLKKEGSFRMKQGIDSDIFCAIFAGSLTMAAGVELYVQAAEKLKYRNDIRIFLVGDGSLRERLEEEIAVRGLRNVQVIHPLKREDVPNIHAAANVLLMSLSGDMAQTAAPSKQIAYMFSGRPVVASVSCNSATAQVLTEANAGFVLPSDDPQAVADLLTSLADDPSSLQLMGENARRYAEKNFSKQAVLPRLINLLETLVNH